MRLNLHPIPGALWNRTSPSFETYEKLYERLVPPSGMAATTRGEALRAVSSLYYDVYNNGGFNLGNDYRKKQLGFLEAFVEDGLVPVNATHVREALAQIEETISKIAEIEELPYEDETPFPNLLEDEPFLLALEKLVEYAIWRAYVLDGGAVALAEAPGSKPEEPAPENLEDLAMNLGAYSESLAYDSRKPDGSGRVALFSSTLADLSELCRRAAMALRAVRP